MTEIFENRLPLTASYSPLQTSRLLIAALMTQVYQRHQIQIVVSWRKMFSGNEVWRSKFVTNNIYGSAAEVCRPVFNQPTLRYHLVVLLHDIVDRAAAHLVSILFTQLVVLDITAFPNRNRRFRQLKQMMP